jgi:hypothetical protein
MGMRLSIGLIIAVLQLTGCESTTIALEPENTSHTKDIDEMLIVHDHEISDFYVQQVSCKDESTSEDNKFFYHYIEHMRDNSVEKLSVDQFLRMARPLVYKGNVHALWTFGIAKYFFIMLENDYDKKSKLSRVIPLVARKRDIVMALTYIFIADGLEGLKPEEKQDFPNRLKQNKGPLKIPPAWIKEAKANAAKWRKHCAKQ